MNDVSFAKAPAWVQWLFMVAATCVHYPVIPITVAGAFILAWGWWMSWIGMHLAPIWLWLIMLAGFNFQLFIRHRALLAEHKFMVEQYVEDKQKSSIGTELNIPLKTAPPYRDL
jgi:hypothetical protein